MVSPNFIDTYNIQGGDDNVFNQNLYELNNNLDNDTKKFDEILRDNESKDL